MKTFFKNLGIMLAISIAALSCSEDIWVHDGEDGYSVVTKVDTIFSNTGKILGYTTSYYTDVDRSGDYTEGDKLQNSFTLFNGANSSIKLSLLPPSSECTAGAVLVESYMGEELTGSIYYCIPPGQQGESGYNLVPEFIEIKIPGEEKVLGIETRLYWDNDRDGVVSPGDEYKGGFITWHGKDGKDGQDGEDGKTPNITFEVVEGFLILTSILNGEIVSQVTIEIPEDGQDGEDGRDGMTPSLYTKEVEPGCDCGKASGIAYIWYFDINKNQIPEKEEIISELIVCNGEDGEDRKTIILLPDIQDDFNHPENSWHYRDKGYIFEEGLVSINQIGSPEGNGTVVLHDYNRNYGYFWTPEFPESAITAIELDVGSMEGWVLKCSFELSDGSVKEMSSYEIKRKINFIWYKTGTYGEPFKYYASLENLEYDDVVRVRFSFYKENDCWMLKDRNHSFNADNLRISRVKILK